MMTILLMTSSFDGFQPEGPLDNLSLSCFDGSQLNPIKAFINWFAKF